MLIAPIQTWYKRHYHDLAKVAFEPLNTGIFGYCDTAYRM